MNSRLIVIIPAVPTSALLGRTLASLAEVPKPACYAHTVVVENAGRGDAESLCAQYASSDLRTRYRFSPPANKSVALNVVLDECDDSDLIVFLDDDVRLNQFLLNAYAAAAERAESGQYFGGPTGVDYERAPPEYVSHKLPASARGWSRYTDPRQDDDLDFLGFNWAAFVGDLKRAGGFDRNRGPGPVTRATGQETDMQRRLRGIGVKPTYVPQAMVWHYVPASRCTPKWAIDRCFRNGLAYGMEMPEQPGLAGVPWWVLGRLCTTTARTALTVAGPTRHRFEARSRQSHVLGMIKGLRKSKATRSRHAAVAVPTGVHHA